MVAARSVGVTVSEFFFTGFTHINDLNSKGQRLACQCVIEVSRDGIIGQCGDRERCRPVWHLRNELHANFKRGFLFELCEVGTLDLHHRFIVTLAIRFICCEGEFLSLADATPHEVGFKTGNHLVVTDEEGQRVATFARIKHLP